MFCNALNYYNLSKELSKISLYLVVLLFNGKTIIIIKKHCIHAALKITDSMAIVTIRNILRLLIIF